ncbi:MAG: hypothetical protein JXR58_07115 [Bacteroidales bacterium]|nr:hypothetical protein [Bacteroidales bacterium]
MSGTTQTTVMIRTSILLVFFSVLALGQNNNEKVLLASEGKYSQYYVELDKNMGYLIALENYYSKAGRYYVATYIDTLAKSEDNNEILFIGNKSKIQLINKEPNIVIMENLQESIKSLKLDTVNDTTYAFIDLNNGIWWSFFLEMCKEINTSFPLYDFSFYDGFGYWASFNNKNENYQSFQAIANNKATYIKDSLTVLNTPLVEITNELLFKIDTIKYDELKVKLMKLPMEYKSESWYFGTVLNALCNSRPEYFYKLVEDIPEKKEMLFGMADLDKSTRKKLKKVETNSPMQKEFIKYRRGETMFAIWGTTIYTAGMIAFWGGIIYLIVK